MTISLIGLLWATAGLLLLPVSALNATAARRAQFAGLFVCHVAASMAYARYAVAFGGDAIAYYDDPLNWAQRGFSIGTGNVTIAMQWLKGVGATYLDGFLIFQLAGLAGLVFVARTIEEIYLDAGVAQPAFSYFIPFCPSLLFWSSAIGKDAPLFMACAIATWASRAIVRRCVILAFACAVMLLIRPHVAMIVMLAVAAAALFDRRGAPLMRIVLGALVVLGSVMVAATVRTAFSVDLADPNSVGDFIASRQEIWGRRDDAASLAGLSYPLRLMSLLMRPLFVDAGGVAGLIASIENLFVIAALVSLMRRWRLVVTLFSQSAHFRFNAVFAISLTLLLTAVYFNLGLGLRERVMIAPSLIAACIMVQAVHARARRSVRWTTDIKHHHARSIATA